MEHTVCITPTTRQAIGAFMLLGTVMAHHAACAQSLPLPSRTVYKCTDNGKTVYSDAPCLGATKLDIEPSRGLNKSSGKERIGADVRHEQHRENMADALRPLTGLDAKGLAIHTRRVNLPTSAQQECRQLDKELAATEVVERASNQSDRNQTQSRLLELRQRFRDLRC